MRKTGSKRKASSSMATIKDKKSALLELQELKKSTNEQKAECTISLNKYPFPEMATFMEMDNSVSSSKEAKPNTQELSEIVSEKKKKKGVKKGKKFATKVDIFYVNADFRRIFP